jgi:prevent-host-death family protein
MASVMALHMLHRDRSRDTRRREGREAISTNILDVRARVLVISGGTGLILDAVLAVHWSDVPSLALEWMTISGHNVTMRQVRIAELKARLSEYLRAVRRGETIAVLDRETLVAQIVPVRERTALRIRKPAPGTPTPNRVPLPKPLKSTIDVVQLLLAERQPHR